MEGTQDTLSTFAGGMMKHPRSHLLDWITQSLLLLFALDRILKLVSVVHFFRRTPPSVPAAWPSVTLIQPITRGASGLSGNLRSRAMLDYPGKIQHLFVCDSHDEVSQQACKQLKAEFVRSDMHMIATLTYGQIPASKIEKMQTAIPHANGDVFWFLDDDIALRPQAFRIMLPHLLQPGVGAAFGLACYTNWSTVWSSLMSAFTWL